MGHNYTLFTEENMANTNISSRRWNIVCNNPQKFWGGTTPPEIIANAMDYVIGGKSETRSCIINYEVGLKTETPHLHIYYVDNAKPRFSGVKKRFPNCHIEIAKGSYEEILLYMKKEGKFSDKAECVIVPPIASDNFVPPRTSHPRKNYLDEIQELLDKGYTPTEILDMNLHYRVHAKIVQQAYFSQKFKETPIMRDVNVVWHCGESGSGKSYTYVNLVNKYGEGNVYHVSKYENGFLDNYSAQDIIFFDEFKGNLPFGTLLTLLDKYKTEIHCRYENTYSLWTQVHVASIFPPDEVYSFMVDDTRKKRDSIEQLLRRISTITYHYKEGDEYKSYSIPAKSYTDYETLKAQALQQVDADGFMSIEDKDIPFDKA